MNKENILMDKIYFLIHLSNLLCKSGMHVPIRGTRIIVKINVRSNGCKSLITGKTRKNIRLMTGYTKSHEININFQTLGFIPVI
jgi:hypothetical protein